MQNPKEDFPMENPQEKR